MTRTVVIGGGFYGANIAVYLKQVRRVSEVVLLERNPALMTRSSFANQARVHSGYHYPRSFTTANRSIVNAPSFIRQFGPAVVWDFDNVYAIARRNSKVTRRQMERFCQEIGAPLNPAPASLIKLFNPALVERVYLVSEKAFDADVLRRLMSAHLAEAGVNVRLQHEVFEIEQDAEGVRIEGASKDGPFRLRADFAFNCTYSRLQKMLGSSANLLPLKHEITEMALVEPPPPLARLAVTIMDGPFFSIMPFPARRLHSLSHVRYTPHMHWTERGEIDPYARLWGYHFESRANWMIRDAARYMPSIAACRPRSSLFEVKTVLTKNEGDDGRPILLERHLPYGRLFSVLGGKMDNIYDVLRRLDAETLPSSEQAVAWTR